MGEVVTFDRPMFALMRNFNEALTRAAKGGAPKTDYERGALATIYVLADVSGMSDDPRARAIWDLIYPPIHNAPTGGAA